MAFSSSSPPLLLTKRLSAFLHANQTPQLPTLLLTTAHGKLLAHASPHPASILRTHATVSASLLAIHTAYSVNIPSALPGSPTPEPVANSPVLDPDSDSDSDSDSDFDDDDDDHVSSPHDNSSAPPKTTVTPRRTGPSIRPVTITVQLSAGTVIIRRLKCGLLFVCIGPGSGSGSSAHEHEPEPDAKSQHEEDADAPTGSSSEVESLVSVGGQTTTSLESASAASVAAMRRHAAELARWLDDKLDTMRVPDEGVGPSK